MGGGGDLTSMSSTGLGETSTNTTSSSAGGATVDGSTTGTDTTGGDDYQACPTDGSVCKVMPFGDSITDGFGVGGAYRVELFRLAHAAGKNITFVGSLSNGPAEVDGVPFPPNHEGHSGFTIDPAGGRSGISPLVGTVMPQFTPHIVLLMIGTNDAIDDIDMQNAPARLGNLIDSIYDELPSVLIIVARPIPSREDPLNTRLLTYGQSIPRVVEARAAAGRHIDVVDMYPVIADNPDYKTELLQDTWHPNAAGHALLGTAWFGALEPWW